MSGELWVYVEQKGGQIRKVSFEMLGAGQKYAAQLGKKFCAVVLGSGIAGLTGAISEYGVDKIYVADNDALSIYNTDVYVNVVSNLVKEQQPDVFIFGNTSVTKDMAPRVAERVQTGMVTDCTVIEIQDGNFIFTRPIYAGKAFTKVVCDTKPVIVTVRPNALGAVEPVGSKQPEVVNVSVDTSGVRTVVREVVEKASGRVELTEAEIIVSGGRGMKGPENFVILEQLADVLGAAVGASRAAVDAGWREHEYQVGQTGKTVSPNLYIACGISGAIQHLAGMSSSKYIVAINKDPEANIFNVCDYGIVDDLFKVVPVLTEEFKKILA